MRFIEVRGAGNKSDLTSSFNALNRVLPACATEVQKSNGVLWGSLTVPELINHVLEYIAWSLDHEKVEAGGVTVTWLDKNRSGKAACGEMRMLMAKINLHLFLETLARDLPEGSVARTEFLRVLAFVLRLR